MKTVEQIIVEKFKWTYDSDPGRFQLFEQLIKPVAIEFAEAYHEEKTRWISVKEQLPKIEILERNDINNSLPVIALLKNGEVYKMTLSHWYEDEPNVFNWVYSDSGEIESNVTHWQPLPKLTQNKV